MKHYQITEEQFRTIGMFLAESQSGYDWFLANLMDLEPSVVQPDPAVLVEALELIKKADMHYAILATAALSAYRGKE